VIETTASSSTPATVAQERAAVARSNERLKGVFLLCAGAMIFTVQD